MNLTFLLWALLTLALTALAGLVEGPGQALVVLGAAAALLMVLSRRALARREEARAMELEEHRKAEHALTLALQVAQRGARTLQAALDGMTEGVWITDETGEVTHHNPALEAMLQAGAGWRGGLKGQRPMFLVRQLELHEAVLRACRAGEATQLELRLDGALPHLFLVRVNPLQPPLKGSTAVFHDVTDLKRLERVRQDFVANVSHELRTPITAILGYAETLQGGAWKDPTHAPRMVEVIHRQCQRLSELVADLLELSKLDASEVKLTIAPVKIGEVARRALDAVALKASDKHLSLKLEVDPELASLAEEKALEQVLINLLDNAVNYTPPDGSVTVVGEREGPLIRLAVRDNGPGIEARHLPRLFERFYRVDRGRSRDQGGTGLGLAIVKHLVAAMQGEVRVASQPGEGSTFTVLLPATGTP